MELETCLTDAHLDDKTMLSKPLGSRQSSRCQFRDRPDLISIRKSWLWQFMLGSFHKGSARCQPRALTAALLVFAQALVGPTGLSAQGTPAPANGASGLPVPRFVSLKSDRVNLRQGPGTEYPTAWVFRRAGLPVEVIKEFESWRQVRDSDGGTGWVAAVLLSARRTAAVAPWVKARTSFPLTESKGGSQEVAKVEPGAIVDIQECDGEACEVYSGNQMGWIAQKNLWGVYPGETVK